MKWPLHQPCEPLSLLLLSITLTASHKCHTISKISLTFILAVPKKENDTWCVYQGRSLIPHSIFFLSFFKLPFKLLNDFVNMFIFCNCFSTEVCFVFSPFPLGCGSVTFTGSNLDCLHLSQPAKLISNSLLSLSGGTADWARRRGVNIDVTQFMQSVVRQPGLEAAAALILFERLVSFPLISPMCFPRWPHAHMLLRLSILCFGGTNILLSRSSSQRSRTRTPYCTYTLTDEKHCIGTGTFSPLSGTRAPTTDTQTQTCFLWCCAPGWPPSPSAPPPVPKAQLWSVFPETEACICELCM